MQKKMIDELSRVEKSDNFIPWDDDRHAIRYLMTIFKVSDNEAKKAVEIYNPSTAS